MFLILKFDNEVTRFNTCDITWNMKTRRCTYVACKLKLYSIVDILK